MGLKITSATDYAIRAMIHLACVPEGTQTLREHIASVEKIPSSFMAKILRSLVRAQLLQSSRGVNGGFSLARPTDEITLLQIVEAVEGPLQLTACSTEDDSCMRTTVCPAASVWGDVQEQVESILQSATLERLVSTPRRNGRVVSAPILKVVSAGESCC